MSKILSYGGGIGSTALLLYKKDEIDEAVFVNHGGDYPHTYEYVKYISQKVFPITIIKPAVEGFDNLYDYLMAKRIIPSIRYRWCTYKFKILPIKRYIAERYQEATVLIGYTYDERHRVRDYKIKGISFEYPFIEDRITREQAIEIIRENGVKLPKKSACFFCPFVKKHELFRLKYEYPHLYHKLKKLHENCMRQDLTIDFEQYDKQKTLLEVDAE